MHFFLLLAALFVLADVGAGLLRLLYGPGRSDRIMSAQLLGTGGIAVLLLLGAAQSIPATIDIALTLALLAAFVSAAFVRATIESDTTEPKDQAET